ncbi:hypothetical protein EST38_g8433 [Candolleomyces aberdarensis]|uniref:Ribonuclease H1 N-terminal domain-containing protein n=1 Tax=Candolleomyces aberdarensis TaxID=2316362 RepID=A0A4Q2DEL6_9AGAR|nr:hypothetical protein EST38_g8433 [Candolleomyces aberdarensis]
MVHPAPFANIDRFQGNEVPLNWSMYRLLVSLLELIDERHGMLGEVHEDGLVGERCHFCNGTGMNMVADGGPVPESPSSEAGGTSDRLDGPSGPSNAGPNTGSTGPHNLSAITTASGSTSVTATPPSITTTVNASPAPAPPVITAVSVPSPPVTNTNANVPAAPAATPTIPATTAASLPAVVINTSAASINVPAAATTINVANVVPTGAPVAGVATGVAGNANLPAPANSANNSNAPQPANPPPLPSLVGQAPPEPENAVFTGLDDERFYSVTRGLRVSVFGAWNIISRFVIGVGGSSYSGFNSREAALRNYTTAYNEGSVSYL